MKVIALTDIHGAYARAEEILAREAPFDAILVGGDLTTRGTAREAEEAIRRLGASRTPVLAIAGNMDSTEVEEAMGRVGTLLDGHGAILQGVGFFGVSGAPVSPMQTPYEIPEEEIMKRAEAGWGELAGAKRRIFVPHAPPRDTRLDIIHGGKHAGSSAVRRFIEARQPDAAICGHIHEARGLDTLGATQMMNCGPVQRGFYGILTLGDTIVLECRGEER
jgi:Icc-related predicted phosphoesterase